MQNTPRVSPENGPHTIEVSPSLTLHDRAVLGKALIDTARELKEEREPYTHTQQAQDIEVPLAAQGELYRNHKSGYINVSFTHQAGGSSLEVLSRQPLSAAVESPIFKLQVKASDVADGSQASRVPLVIYIPSNPTPVSMTDTAELGIFLGQLTDEGARSRIEAETHLSRDTSFLAVGQTIMAGLMPHAPRQTERRVYRASQQSLDSTINDPIERAVSLTIDDRLQTERGSKHTMKGTRLSLQVLSRGCGIVELFKYEEELGENPDAPAASLVIKSDTIPLAILQNAAERAQRTSPEAIVLSALGLLVDEKHGCPYLISASFPPRH